MKKGRCRWCRERIAQPARLRIFCSHACRELDEAFTDLDLEEEPTEATVSSSSIGSIMLEGVGRGTGNGEGKRKQAKDYPYAMTHDEIAARLGISRQRVQQIQAGALAKLRVQFGNDVRLKEMLCLQ